MSVDECGWKSNNYEGGTSIETMYVIIKVIKTLYIYYYVPISLNIIYFVLYSFIQCRTRLKNVRGIGGYLWIKYKN